MASNYEVEVRFQFDRVPLPRAAAPPGQAMEAFRIETPVEQANGLTINLYLNSQNRISRGEALMRWLGQAIGLVRRVVTYLAAYLMG